MSKVLVTAGMLPFLSCVNALLNSESLYDGRSFQITTVSLFNQRTPSRYKVPTWKGDWVFRRERLSLVDQYLRQNVPDILLVQQAMQKRGSLFDADEQILSAGALKDFDWKLFSVATYADTVEQESMGYAINVTLDYASLPAEQRSQWELGPRGHMTLQVIGGGDSALLVFNISMPDQEDGQYIWYRFVKDQIMETIKRLHSCPERVVLGGLIPGDQGVETYQDLLTQLNLKDASTGYCQVMESCQTSSPENQIFLATIGDESPQRLDRILIHNSAIVYNSNRSFDVISPNHAVAEKYGFQDLWATQRLGWSVNARFAKCRQN